MPLEHSKSAANYRYKKSLVEQLCIKIYTEDYWKSKIIKDGIFNPSKGINPNTYWLDPTFMTRIYDSAIDGVKSLTLVQLVWFLTEACSVNNKKTAFPFLLGTLLPPEAKVTNLVLRNETHRQISRMINDVTAMERLGVTTVTKCSYNLDNHILTYPK